MSIAVSLALSGAHTGVGTGGRSRNQSKEFCAGYASAFKSTPAVELTSDQAVVLQQCATLYVEKPITQSSTDVRDGMVVFGVAGCILLVAMLLAALVTDRNRK
jgi:hypothetical protein